VIFIESFKNLFIKLALIITFLIIIIYNFFISKNTYEEFNTIESVVESSNENKVELEEKAKIKVYVAGEVNNPGVFELDKNSRVENAISSAGGLTNLANIKNINLALIVEDGEKIYIPNINDNDTMEYTSTEESSKTSKININKATINELQNLPGVGSSLAEKIFNYRKENGNFKKIEDLKKVNGIGEKKFEALKEYISL
jgi:competence protein ComEA